MTTEESDITPRSRKRAARRISNELRDAVNQRVADGPSQFRLTTMRQVTDISSNAKKVQSGNVEDPIKFGDLSYYFYYILCDFKNAHSTSSKLCFKEMDHRQGSASFLKDAANQRRNVVCRASAADFHSRCKQTYYTHKNTTCKSLKEKELYG